MHFSLGTSTAEIKRFRDVANMNASSASGLRTSSHQSHSTWNVPSSNRCLQCGALGCTQHKVVVDPDRKRRNEEAVRMNTPFYRQKLLQRVGDTLDEETFARHQLKEWQVGDLRGLWDAHRADLRVLHHISGERAAREQLGILERKQRHSLRTARRRDELSLELVLHEHEQRELLEQKWLRGGAAIRDLHIDVMMVLSIQEKEMWTRYTLVEKQSSAFSYLLCLNEECQSCLNANTRARRMLIEACLNDRDDIILARIDKMESLAGSFRQGEALVAEWHRERQDLALEAERSVRDVAAEQDVVRRRLRDAMAASYEETLEVEKMLADERAELVKLEAKARVSLEADEAHFNHGIFLWQQKGAEEAHELMEMKKATRADFEQQALWHVRHLTDEEHAAFSNLLAWGREHAERTAQRIVSNRRAREQLVERFRETAGLLWDSRCDELTTLRQKMLIETDEVERCTDERRQVLKRFAADCFKELSRLALQELDVRAELLARRDQEHEDVIHFTEYKSSERNGVAIAEVSRRLKLEELEVAARGAVASARSDALDAARRRWMEFASQWRVLERGILQDRHALADDEDVAFHVLLCGLEAALYMTLADEQARERQRFDACESRNRNEGLLAEVRHRDQIRLQMTSERRAFERHVQATREAYLSELTVREEGDRLLVTRHWQEAMEHLRMDYVRDLYEAEDLVAARLKIRLLQRQEYMLEDPRLLDPFEEPLAEAEMSIAEFRKSVQINSPHRPSAYNAVHCQLEFVQTALNCDDLGHLPMHLLTSLAELVDLGNDATLAARDNVTRMTRENENLRKALTKEIAAEESTREKKDFYTKKLERDAQSYKERREGERRERAKEEARLTAEQRRCKEKQKLVKEKIERNEILKDSIRMDHTKR